MAKKIRIVLDTNWYVSATINGKSRKRLYKILSDDRVLVLWSQELWSEYSKVMVRPKFQKMVTLSQIERFVNLTIGRLTEVKIKTSVAKSRDPDDDYLLSMSLDGKADYLVTGDPHLLELKEIGKTKILRMIEFEDVMSKM